MSLALDGSFKTHEKVNKMRTSTPFAHALSIGAIFVLLAGCSGASNAGSSSGFTPTLASATSARPLIQQPVCLIVKGDVPLASAASFAVLGGSTVTSTGLTILDGNLGVSPGTSITGFGPGVVKHGQIYAGGSVAGQAQADLAIGYNYAAGLQNPTAVPPEIGGMTIEPGIYNAATSLGISGTLTLDGRSKPNSIFVFQVPSTLTTAVLSRVKLINKANACNVFWQVGSSATLNMGAKFRGTIMAADSISVSSGVVVRGRLLAETGGITLIDDRDFVFYTKR
jgi:Ice-binding-like